jgi:hypothetical protein
MLSVALFINAVSRIEIRPLAQVKGDTKGDIRRMNISNLMCNYKQLL